MAFKAYQYFSFGNQGIRTCAKIDIAWRKNAAYKASYMLIVASVLIYATVKTFLRSDAISNFSLTFFAAALLFNFVIEPFIFRKIPENEIEEEIRLIREDNQARLARFDQKYDKKIAVFGKMMKWFLVFLIAAVIFMVILVIKYGAR